MRVVQKQLYLSLSAWSKGLKCTEKACKIGNLRRQCYDAIEAVKMAGPLEVQYELTFHYDSSSK